MGAFSHILIVLTRCALIDAYILLIHGKEDKLCSIEGSRAIARNDDTGLMTYLELDGIYHEVHNGGSESDGSEVILKIRDFIESLE